MVKLALFIGSPKVRFFVAFWGDNVSFSRAEHPLAPQQFTPCQAAHLIEQFLADLKLYVLFSC